jgi:hypothetical protein
MISKAELRQWVRGGTIEEAQEAIDAIKETDGGSLADLFTSASSGGEE